MTPLMENKCDNGPPPGFDRFNKCFFTCPKKLKIGIFKYRSFGSFCFAFFLAKDSKSEKAKSVKIPLNVSLFWPTDQGGHLSAMGTKGIKTPNETNYAKKRFMMFTRMLCGKYPSASKSGDP